MKNILCYGDSNTFGSIPGGGRYPYGVRWPGRLAGLLGADWHLIEEGMGGRTTVWEDPLEDVYKRQPMPLQSRRMASWNRKG